MCDPVSASIALAAGSGIQAYGQYQQGKAEAGMLKQNARLADQQARDRVAMGAIAEERVRQQVRATAGAQRAALGANGVDLGSGTALQLQTDTAGMGEKEATLARANALREAWEARSSPRITATRRRSRVAARTWALSAPCSAAAPTRMGPITRGPIRPSQGHEQG